MRLIKNIKRIGNIIFEEDVVREIHYTRRDGKMYGAILTEHDWEMVKFLAMSVSALTVTIFVPIIQMTGNLFLIKNYSLWWIELLKNII